MVNSSIFWWVLFGAGLINWLIRITPVLVAQWIKFPAGVIRFLHFVPLSMMSAILLQNLVSVAQQRLVVDWLGVMAVLPAIIIGYWRNSLTWTVFVGVLMMMLLRLL